ASQASVSVSGARQEAISALQNLGYSPTDAARAVATAAQSDGDGDTAALIKSALKELAPS
ncbi:MAG: Holliday junction branch migration protein RuvA, partial [Pseudomonadota bacterium]